MAPGLDRSRECVSQLRDQWVLFPCRRLLCNIVENLDDSSQVAVHCCLDDLHAKAVLFCPSFIRIPRVPRRFTVNGRRVERCLWRHLRPNSDKPRMKNGRQRFYGSGRDLLLTGGTAVDNPHCASNHDEYMYMYMYLQSLDEVRSKAKAGTPVGLALQVKCD